MTLPARPEWPAETFEQFTAYVRLDLPAERREPVAEMLGATMRRIDSLDRFDLGETPPATAFDARWD